MHHRGHRESHQETQDRSVRPPGHGTGGALSRRTPDRRSGLAGRHLGPLLWLLIAYAVASLIHFSHNAAFLDEYPNMPAWLSPARVYAAWIGITCIGVAGYALLCRGFELAGLVVIGIYGAPGLDSLVHYGVAAPSAHTSAMHFTILLDAATGAALLAAVAVALLRRSRKAPL